MNTRVEHILRWVTIVVLVAMAISAHAVSSITSKGFPPSTTVTLDGVGSEAVWAAAGPPTTITVGSPTGSLTLFHTNDSIYFLAVVQDVTSDPTDAVTLRFASGADCNSDFGVTIPRGATTTATWGAGCNNEAGWATLPTTNYGVKDNGGNWVVEFKLPIALPSGQTISFAQNLGFAFAFCDASAFCVYNPWPSGASIHDPTTWGQIIFDPKTTFPDIAVTNAKTLNANPDLIARPANSNTFVVTLNNPGGTAIPDATGVRVNLYLSARGIGEPWHRFDASTTLGEDCTAASINQYVLPRAQVCSGNSPQPDIGSPSINLSDIVGNTAVYTIQNGVTRTGGDNLTINGGSTLTDTPVLSWVLTSQQDALYRTLTVGGQTYDRNHDCLLAQVISPNDPNPANDTLQVNMDFPVLSGGMKKSMRFSVAPEGFLKYDPNVGKSMLLQVVRTNMDQNFQFNLNGVRQLQPDLYQADLKGTASVPLTADITPPSSDVFGKTIKENLMVPPRAGEEVGEKHHWCPFRRKSDQPVIVRVTPGSTIWVTNYSLTDDEVQFVDVDGGGPLPRNGPEGLPSGLIKKPRGTLLVPKANVGELVLSFDNFKTGVGIGDGVQVRVPSNANQLYLAINDSHKGYDDHKGTGFRVKIIERPLGATPKVAQRRMATQAAEVGITSEPNIYPIADVLPTVCVNGYEDLDDKILVAGKPLEMYRMIGNVCWRINAILPGTGINLQDKPDKPAPNNPGQ